MPVTEETAFSFDDLPSITRPQDRQQPEPNLQRVEARDLPITFEWDGEKWTFKPSDATGLEFLAALEDEQIIKALRLLLGNEQAARLIKGRKLRDLAEFFNAAGQAGGTGNL
ncbi:hypothetical protein ACFV9C_25390 [Kribbella sp. NPDC059898]|uniref:hypothetical protein n=1 Tax=Kribbella sp. NPDC059898 TaxID=3346995 RepID=UPI003655C046